MKTTFKKVYVVGKVKELNFKKDKKDGVERYLKNNYRQPSILLEVNGVDIPLHYKFPVKDIKRFEKIENLIESCKTRDMLLEVEAFLELDENAYNGKWYSKPQFNIFDFKMDSLKSESSSIVLDKCYIVKIEDEIIKEKETGREKYTVLCLEETFPEKELVVKPFTVLTEKVITDEDGNTTDISGYYNVGDTAKLYLEYQSKFIGGKNKSTGGFGKTKIASDGFFINELVLVGGEEPTEEEELQYNTEEITKLVKERKKMIADKVAESETTVAVQTNTVENNIDEDLF